ncbi:peptidase S28 [Cubamyces sp. BRFM 1775]|nr:peptidase S28 [Cubamyces sp. BRFM 1775]
MVLLRILAPLLLSACVCASPGARSNVGRGVPKVPVQSYEVTHKTTGEPLPPLDTVYYFDQLIDHDDPTLGTFQQRYWVSAQYYQPGGPILLMSGGEGDATDLIGYLTNYTITGWLAEKLNGTVILMEHRFFGESNPYPDLSSESLRLLTLQQAIEDYEYFLTNVHLPMPGGDQVGPDKAPWVLFGGSYSGALASYTMYNKPGLFAAGYASSAVVESISDYWQYYDIIRQFMPQNCSADVEAVAAHVDKTFSLGNDTDIQSLKDTFGLGEVTHSTDFAWALAGILELWQELLITSGPNAPFYQFCDALEVKDGQVAGPDGWGLENALAAWGSYFKHGPYLQSTCGSLDSSTLGTCLNSYDPTVATYTNITVNNWFRSWRWLLCNEIGFWEGGAPEGTPSLISHLVTPEYFERECPYFFPEAFTSPPNSDLRTARTNERYGGWNVTIEHLIFANGRRDPWRDTTVAADGSTNLGSDLNPHLLGEGFHASDMSMLEGDADPSVRAVQLKALQYLSQWLSEWKPSA